MSDGSSVRVVKCDMCGREIRFVGRGKLPRWCDECRSLAHNEFMRGYLAGRKAKSRERAGNGGHGDER